MNKKPGDWNCSSCQHLNFSRRDSCQRCGEPRPSRGEDRGSSSGVRPGDWYCSCAAHNFASRSNCFKCGAPKDESSSAGGSAYESSGSRASRSFGSGSRSVWKPGDWRCSSCNEHNFASRTECFRCGAPREQR